MVVQAAEVFHAVLEIPHVAEEVSGELLHGLYGRGGCERGPGRAVLEVMGDGGWRGRVASYEGGYEEG